jgi:5-methylthioadenosine/S-adenosylhomocysteine deaminase
MLSRSRYFAPALQSLRFYREYFKPNREIEVIKERHRYLIEYQGAEFFLNFDAVITPALGQFLEIKSRTWSRQDAENKSKLVQKLLKLLIDQPCEYVNEDYYDLVLSAGH